MKIILLASWYPSKLRPYDGDFIQRFAEHLHQQRPDIDLTVFHAVKDPQQKKDFKTEITDRPGFQEIRIYHREGGNPFRNWNLYQQALDRAFQLYVPQKGQPDLVHVQIGWRAGWIARWWERRYHIPYIVTEHSTGFYTHAHNYYPVWQRHLIRRVHQKAEAVVAVSPQLLKAIPKRSGLKYLYIPNLVEARERVTSQPLKTGEIHLVHVSNLHSKHKNTIGLIRAITPLLRQHPELHLDILGDGEDFHTVDLYLEQQQLEKKVHLKGQLPYEATQEYLRNAHVLVMFSNYETFSLVTAEAVLAGTPVITTACGGPESYLRESPWIRLIEPGNEQELFLELQLMLPALKDFPRIPEEESYRLKLLLGPEKVIAAYSELYEEISGSDPQKKADT